MDSLSLINDLLRDNLIDKKYIDYLKKYNIQTEDIIETLIKLALLKKDTLIDFLIQGVHMHEYSIEYIKTLKFLPQSIIESKLHQKSNTSFIDLKNSTDYSMCENIDINLMKQNNFIAINIKNKNMIITSSQIDINLENRLQFLCNKQTFKIYLANKHQIDSLLFDIQKKDKFQKYIKEIEKELIINQDNIHNDSNILNLINLILQTTIDSRGSDIHIESEEKKATIRIRIDGVLKQLFTFKLDIYHPLISRLKLLSNLNIAQKRKPQDGRFTHTNNNIIYDIRLSTLPTIYGESMVLRVLHTDEKLLDLSNSSMSEHQIKRFKDVLSSPFGLILLTGPTGSGKTTTLYAALYFLRSITKKIITLEDPVEYEIESLQQVNISEFGLQFAQALRHVLRQDPDKIMVGEIRDKQTLDLAVEASLTGHLVLSTLHTNHAIATITRLKDMGADSYLLSDGLKAIVSQRLVRKLCTCKTLYNIPKEIVKKFSFNNEQIFYKPNGCQKCGYTGYYGRVMISESLFISEKIGTLIHQASSSQTILKQAKQEGFITLLEDGINKVKSGDIYLHELLGVLNYESI